MTLIICPECKENISDTADSCPKCGYKITPEKIAELKEKQKFHPLLTFFILVIVIFGVFHLFTSIADHQEESERYRYIKETQEKTKKLRKVLDDADRWLEESQERRNTGKEPILHQNKNSWKEFDNAYKKKLEQETKKIDYSKYTKREKEIYDYMQLIWDEYERKYGISTAEDLVFENTARKFGITTDEVLRIFNKVDKTVFGY